MEFAIATVLVWILLGLFIPLFVAGIYLGKLVELQQRVSGQLSALIQIAQARNSQSSIRPGDLEQLEPPSFRSL